MCYSNHLFYFACKKVGYYEIEEGFNIRYLKVLVYKYI